MGKGSLGAQAHAVISLPEDPFRARPGMDRVSSRKKRSWPVVAYLPFRSS